jgi:hypothetical protein
VFGKDIAGNPWVCRIRQDGLAGIGAMIPSEDTSHQLAHAICATAVERGCPLSVFNPETA